MAVKGRTPLPVYRSGKTLGEVCLFFPPTLCNAVIREVLAILVGFVQLVVGSFSPFLEPSKGEPLKILKHEPERNAHVLVVSIEGHGRHRRATQDDKGVRAAECVDVVVEYSNSDLILSRVDVAWENNVVVTLCDDKSGKLMWGKGELKQINKRVSSGEGALPF